MQLISSHWCCFSTCCIRITFVIWVTKMHEQTITIMAHVAPFAYTPVLGLKHLKIILVLPHFQGLFFHCVSLQSHYIPRNFACGSFANLLKCFEMATFGIIFFKSSISAQNCFSTACFWKFFGLALSTLSHIVLFQHSPHARRKNSSHVWLII